MRRLPLFIVPLLLFLQTISAYALPGEAAAVIRHCGMPSAENIATSEVTNRMQRDLTYGNTILHFVPDGNDWSFTTAWRGHLPVMRSQMEADMPCFRDAIAEVAAAPQPTVDPTIAKATVVPVGGVGIPHLGLILLLAASVLLLILLPRRGPDAAHELPSARRLRKPGLPAHLLRRYPHRRLTTL